MENQPKKLYRSQKDKIIAGVCAGLAKYFEIDPILIRGAFLLLALINGAGLILYLILAVIVPKEPDQDSKTDDSKNTEEKIKENVQDLKNEARQLAEKMKNKSWLSDKRNVIGLIIVIVGLIALANQFVPQWFSWKLFWSLTLVFVGFYIILKR
jgi:phage shock protein C